MDLNHSSKLNSVNKGRLKKLKDLYKFSNMFEGFGSPYCQYFGIDVSLKGTAVSISIPVEDKGNLLHINPALNFLNWYLSVCDLKESPFYDCLEIQNELQERFFKNVVNNTVIFYDNVRKHICIHTKFAFNKQAKFFSSELIKIYLISIGVKQVSEKCREIVLSCLDWLRSGPHHQLKGKRESFAQEHFQTNRYFKDNLEVKTAITDGRRSLKDNVSKYYILSVEEVSVSTQFSGMRAVAACFGAITSGFFAAISSDPNVKSFLVSNTVKSSMDSFVRSRIELESELQFRDLNVKDGWSNNKKTAQTYASMIVGWSVEDDDLADAICHREFIINLREALEDIKEEVEFALENQTDTIIKEYYLGIKNKMESKYGLNLDSVLRYAKKMTQDDFGTLEGSHVLSND